MEVLPQVGVGGPAFGIHKGANIVGGDQKPLIGELPGNLGVTTQPGGVGINFRPVDNLTGQVVAIQGSVFVKHQKVFAFGIELEGKGSLLVGVDDTDYTAVGLAELNTVGTHNGKILPIRRKVKGRKLAIASVGKILQNDIFPGGKVQKLGLGNGVIGAVVFLGGEKKLFPDGIRGEGQAKVVIDTAGEEGKNLMLAGGKVQLNHVVGQGIPHIHKDIFSFAGGFDGSGFQHVKQSIALQGTGILIDGNVVKAIGRFGR